MWLAQIDLNMIRNRFLIIMVALFFVSCSGDSPYYFYSPDKSQCFTIKTNKHIRYIINGYHKSIPKTNFVKLDLSKVDRGAGDQIVGRWNRNGFNWVIVMDKVVVLENTLDSSKFQFLSQFPLDDQGIPTLKDYICKDCFSISLEYGNLTRIEGSLVN